jgi:hypothetical protein
VVHADVESAFTRYFVAGDSSQQEPVLVATTLARWLIASALRPVAMGGGSC